MQALASLARARAVRSAALCGSSGSALLRSPAAVGLAPVKPDPRRLGRFDGGFGSSTSRGVATAAVSRVSRACERELQQRGFACVAGVDESGTGTLAGPLVAAACVLPPGFDLSGVKDSKKLSRPRREQMFKRITRAPGVVYATVVMGRAVIDEINTHQATLRAMKQAVALLTRKPNFVLIDGRDVPSGLPCGAKGIVKGDATEACVAAASIIATATHDRLMAALHAEYPGYAFAEHRGYSAAAHVDAIRRFGCCEEHRRSTRLVKALCEVAA